MANNPKKVKDPTEVALSAIQEALNISDAPPDNRGSVRSDAGQINSPSTSPYNDTFDTRDSRSNDDRPTFEQIEERSPRRELPLVPPRVLPHLARRRRERVGGRGGLERLCGAGGGRPVQQ